MIKYNNREPVPLLFFTFIRRHVVVPIVFYCFFYGHTLAAQKLSSFYIEPSLAWKVDITSKPPTPAIVLPYLDMRTTRRIGPGNIWSCNAGINVGYCFKNSDKIQLGIMYDDSQQGFSYTGVESSGPGINSQTWSSYHSGPLYTNISLLYKRSILFIKSRCLNPDRFIRVHLVAGIMYCYKPNHGISQQNNYGTTFIAPDSSRYTVTADQYDVHTNFFHSLKFNIGLDITFGKGNREWFTLAANFVHGNSGSYLSYIAAEVDVDKLGKHQIYYANYPGYGNGFYFTLSRRFFLQRKYAKSPGQPVHAEDHIQN